MPGSVSGGLPGAPLERRAEGRGRRDAPVEPAGVVGHQSGEDGFLGGHGSSIRRDVGLLAVLVGHGQAGPLQEGHVVPEAGGVHVPGGRHDDHGRAVVRRGLQGLAQAAASRSSATTRTRQSVT